MKESNVFNKIFLFAIIICSLKYPKDELYNVNDVNIHPQRNTINFGNGRILSHADKPFDLNYFYGSVLTLDDQKEYDSNSDDISLLGDIPDIRINDLKSNKLWDLKGKFSKPNKLANVARKNVSSRIQRGGNKTDPQVVIKNLSNNDVLVILEESMNDEGDEYITLNKYLENFKLMLDDNSMTDLDYDQIEEEYNNIFRNVMYNKSLRKHINKKLFKILSRLVLWNASVTFLTLYINALFAAMFSISVLDFKIQYKQIKKLPLHINYNLFCLTISMKIMHLIGYDYNIVLNDIYIY
ncbi:fam-b protein [Plasmodium vinckei brucechwatti]|uniref:Fam-b protein n=1 Tax=Plasmodium vinckei brucechwatti TaxID=119398 RepID=A0A6V7RV05_PLAVN|nr:fam-b protein [Plasmodium vinckei brucechwatti]